MSHHVVGEDVTDAVDCTELLNTARFRSMLQEHSVNIMSQINAQQSKFIEVVTASIDAKFEQHRELLQANFENMRVTVVAEALEQTKCVVSSIADDLNANLTAAVHMEVSNLERKVTAMIESGSTAYSSGSQQLSSSGSSAVSSTSKDSVGSNEFALGGRSWVCPFCRAPLKHEKSFHDHMTLLLSRVHELPVVRVNKKGVRKADNRCLFNIDNPLHHAVLSPWNRDGLSFWHKAEYFMHELMSRLHPGFPQAISESNPNYDIVFKFIDECRNGVFVPQY